MSSQKDRNRQAFPTIAKWVDELRSVFGDVRVTYVEENGRSSGTPGESGIPPAGDGIIARGNCVKR